MPKRPGCWQGRNEMTGQIILTREEARGAIMSLRDAYESDHRRWACFGNYDYECHQDFEQDSPCHFCKRLTEFAKEE